MIVDITALRKLAPRANERILLSLLDPLNKWLPKYEIMTTLRICHFLAQACHEADEFKTLVEYASGKAYEGRKDLGNIRPGDGARFKGRGIFQLTGRVNYEAYGRRVGIDLVGSPAMASEPELAVRIACEYWRAKGLNTWADRDDIREVTRRINGGYNGLAKRQAYLAKAKKLFPLSHTKIVKPPPESPPTEEVPDAPARPDAAKPWWQSTEIISWIGGVFASIVSAAASPWGVATIAVLVIAGFAAWGIYRRMQRENLKAPT